MVTGRNKEVGLITPLRGYVMEGQPLLNLHPVGGGHPEDNANKAKTTTLSTMKMAEETAGIEGVMAAGTGNAITKVVNKTSQTDTTVVVRMDIAIAVGTSSSIAMRTDIDVKNVIAIAVGRDSGIKNIIAGTDRAIMNLKHVKRVVTLQRWWLPPTWRLHKLLCR